MRQAAGLDEAATQTYHPEERDERVQELIMHLVDRSPSQALSDFKRQLYNVWSPNSFVSRRILGLSNENTIEAEARRSRWLYGLPRAWLVPLAILVTWSYVVVMVLGLTGLCSCEPSPFKTFSILLLLSLSALGLLVFMSTRYRVAFLFVPLLHTAHLATNATSLFDRLREPRRALALLALLVLFAHILVTKRHAIGVGG